MKTENKVAKKKNYIAPDIEVVEIEIEQNIFAGSGDGITNGIPGTDNEDWW